MAQRTLDVTLVRMCEVFERERSRTSEELLQPSGELAFMATHDPLTGLPNRTLILDRGERMLGRARRQQMPVAALILDLDNFTSINDTLGHAVGDELLQAVARDSTASCATSTLSEESAETSSWCSPKRSPTAPARR